MLKIEIKRSPTRTKEPANTGSYTYSSRSLIFSKNEGKLMHGYKVHSKYTNFFGLKCVMRNLYNFIIYTYTISILNMDSI